MVVAVVSEVWGGSILHPISSRSWPGTSPQTQPPQHSCTRSVISLNEPGPAAPHTWASMEAPLLLMPPPEMRVAHLQSKNPKIKVV